MRCALENRNILFILFNANSDLTCWNHFGSKNRGDAAEADGLALIVERLQHGLNVSIHRAVLPLHCPGTQVLSCTKAT